MAEYFGALEDVVVGAEALAVPVAAERTALEVKDRDIELTEGSGDKHTADAGKRKGEGLETVARRSEVPSCRVCIVDDELRRL